MTPPSALLRLAPLASVLLLANLAVAADPTESAFDAANQLYGQGKFAEAAAAYETLLQSGTVSEALYFNLGNAFYKAGQTGRAIAAYRNAEQLAPRDPDVRTNLRFLRDQIQGPRHVPGRLQRWLGRLSVNEWTGLTAAALWICSLSLAAIQFRPAWKRSLRGLALLSGLMTIVFGIGLTATLAFRSTQIAIVAVPEAVAHSGPFDEFQNAFTARDGAELKVVDRKDNWLQVSADNGKAGWIKRDQVVLADGS